MVVSSALYVRNMNNLVYFSAIPRDDIYEIDLSSSNTNDSSMYTVSNKRVKLDLDSTLLWHCRLGHIIKKRIEKLQYDRLLNSTDIKSFEKCVSCMSGKMARKPYSHQVERTKDLVGLINTDVRERRNRTLLDMVRSMMSQTTLPKSFWDYALESVARILNMVSTKKVKKTPYEVWHGQVLKLIPKETMGYSFYYPPENKVFVARNANFFKNSLINQEASGSLEDLVIIQEEDMHPSLDTSLNHEECAQEIDEPQTIAAFYDYEIWQMDVKTAFLNEYLNEENPGELHLTTVKNILKYLRNTKDMFLVYGGDIKLELRVSCYTEAGYLTDTNDLKSQTRYVLVVNGGDVDWKSTKQSIFETSSIDVEYITAFDASKEAVWILKFIYGLDVVPTIEEPIGMYCDNTRAIAIAKDHGITKGARHFLQDIFAQIGMIVLKMKVLEFSKHSELTRKIGMIPASGLM
ncbi:zinc finger, CCHC-type containing protein [Tanacetum coccineum]